MDPFAGLGGGASRGGGGRRGRGGRDMWDSPNREPFKYYTFEEWCVKRNVKEHVDRATKVRQLNKNKKMYKQQLES